MILVEVYVPSLDQSYDFQMEEQATVAKIKKAIYEALCRKEKESEKEVSENRFSLWSVEKERRLMEQETLWEAQITDGCRLIYL